MPNHFHEDPWKPMRYMPPQRRYEPFLGALQLSNGRWEMYVIFCDDNGTHDLHYSCSECGWNFEDFTHWMELPSPPSPTNT